MDKVDRRIKQYYNKYVDYITNNAETTADIEVLVKYLSYFVSGKLTDNSIISEGLFSLSNLLVLFNDQMIRRKLTRNSFVGHKTEENIKLFLTVLEDVEVLIEFTSEKILGKKKKFIIIFMIQAVKCIGRLILIVKYKNRISQSPAIEKLNRKDLRNLQISNHSSFLQPELEHQLPSVTIKLKRSGKVLRKIENAPPLHARSFQSPELQPTDRFGCYNHKDIKTAELIYIFKPMLHLGSCGLFGFKSWKSYALSMFLDIYSIRQYYNNRQYLTSDQKKEMSRRCVGMLLYILRSPFYDQYSNDKIDSFMRAISRTIPLAKLIVEPYRELIPHYQQSYFYMWSN